MQGTNKQANWFTSKAFTIVLCTLVVILVLLILILLLKAFYGITGVLIFFSLYFALTIGFVFSVMLLIAIGDIEVK